MSKFKILIKIFFYDDMCVCNTDYLIVCISHLFCGNNYCHPVVCFHISLCEILRLEHLARQTASLHVHVRVCAFIHVCVHVHVSPFELLSHSYNCHYATII